MKLVLTCEHGGNLIPEHYKYLFVKGEKELNSHRGYDFGALDLFDELKDLSDYSRSNSISRLLIEINRSIGHPALFSEFTNTLSQPEKEQIISKFYYPYRNDIEHHIEKLLGRGEAVLHLSIHSFTPQLNGESRNADVGLLYDPSREFEKAFCKNLKRQLKLVNPDLRVRYNYPYLGTADGFTTYLRKKFQNNYSGIEIEVNQKFSKNNMMQNSIKENFHATIQNLIK